VTPTQNPTGARAPLTAWSACCQLPLASCYRKPRTDIQIACIRDQDLRFAQQEGKRGASIPGVELFVWPDVQIEEGTTWAPSVGVRGREVDTKLPRPPEKKDVGAGVARWWCDPRSAQHGQQGSSAWRQAGWSSGELMGALLVIPSWSPRSERRRGRRQAKAVASWIASTLKPESILASVKHRKNYF
jgi:hypothetical protein